MSNLKLLSKILRLKGMKITDFQFKDYGRELHLSIKPYKNGCRCADCGRRGRFVSPSKEARSWQDIAVLGVRVVLWYWPERSSVRRTDAARKRFRGRPRTRGSRTGRSGASACCASG